MRNIQWIYQKINDYACSIPLVLIANLKTEIYFKYPFDNQH